MNEPQVQPPVKPPALTRKEVSFRIKEEHRAFFMKGFARFMQPIEIFGAFAEQNRELLEGDCKRYGIDRVREYVSERIYRLNPNSSRDIEPHLLEIFEAERSRYLEDLDSVYLSHPKNRLQELDTLYQLAMDRVLGGDGDKRDIQDALAVLREARSEMASKAISVTASVEDGKAMLAIHSNVQNMSDDQIKALMGKHERGEPISFPDTSGNGSQPVLPNPATGTPSEASGGAGTPKGADKATQE